jgi:ferredoxin-NADP reductase
METAARSARYVVKLKERREVAERTYAFSLEKPKGFRFRPGQYISVVLENPAHVDPQGNGRDFSIASAPHEDEILVATRLRDSSLKHDLVSLPLQSIINLEGPFGGFTLHNNATRPAVLLAGGIGVTPFRSMVFHAARERLGHRIVLFYSNHRPEDAPFLDELQALEKESSNYRFVGTMTAMERSSRNWHAERGRLSRAMLLNHLQGLVDPIFYAAGPPGMVSGAQVLLREMGIDDDNIRTEEFPGY